MNKESDHVQRTDCEGDAVVIAHQFIQGSPTTSISNPLKTEKGTGQVLFHSAFDDLMDAITRLVL